LEVGRYLKLFEGECFAAIGRISGYPVILKGLNADGVAQQLWENWQQFEDPVCVGLDASRFDQHISADALRFEHSIYNDVFRSPHLAELLSWQLRNTGYARVDGHCVKYTVDGGRMSGDINTSLGNCIIMVAIVQGYLASRQIRGRLGNNGDDCALFIERRDLPKMSGISDWFLDFGFKLTIEDTVDVFEHVGFCQCYPVLVGGRWRMVRDPFVAVSKDCVSLLSWGSEEEFATWRDAIGTCGLELTRGVPVWESFYQALKSGDRQGGMEAVYQSGIGHLAKGVRAVEIDDNARHSFWRAFGITPDEQVALEQSWPKAEFRDMLGLTKFTDFVNQAPLRWLHEGKATRRLKTPLTTSALGEPPYRGQSH